MERKTWLDRLCVGLLLTFPFLAMLHRSVPSITFYLFVGAGLLRLGSLLKDESGRRSLGTFWKEYWVLCVIMMLPLCLNFISTASAGVVQEAFSAGPKRFALTGLVVFALLGATQRSLKMFQWGAIAAALAASIILLVASGGGAVRPRVPAQNLLIYTNFVVLLGIYCLYMLEWQLTQHTFREPALKIAAFLSSVYSVFLSRSRGPLLAMAVLLGLYGMFGLSRYALRWRIAGAAAMLLILVAVVGQSDKMRARLLQASHAMIASVPALMEGEAPTAGEMSTRKRLELWQASWYMFKEHPWIGDASRPFNEKLLDASHKGEISDKAMRGSRGRIFTHAHNDLMEALSSRGIAGAAVLLLLYLIPLHYFIRRRRTDDRICRMAADMGIATVVGTALFGLTMAVFAYAWMVALYGVLVAIFLSLSSDRRCIE